MVLDKAYSGKIQAVIGEANTVQIYTADCGSSIEHILY
jgi:hypothetical protein